MKFELGELISRLVPADRGRGLFLASRRSIPRCFWKAEDGDGGDHESGLEHIGCLYLLRMNTGTVQKYSNSHINTMFFL